MSNKTKDLVVIFLLCFILAIKPISYDELKINQLKSKKLNHYTENSKIVSNSYILNKNYENELQALEASINDIVLVKGNSDHRSASSRSSGSFFTEAITPNNYPPNKRGSLGNQNSFSGSGSENNPNVPSSSNPEFSRLEKERNPLTPSIPSIEDDRKYSDKRKHTSKVESYSEVMARLESEKNKKLVRITIGNRTYVLENLNPGDVYQLEQQLANKMYENIRSNKKDVSQIVEQTPVAESAIQQCKDHVFYNKHRLDSYELLGEPVEYGRFDPNLQQALAWERFKNGQATPQDLEWARHEILESRYEARFNAGYRDSHAYAQKYANGAPWTDE